MKLGLFNVLYYWSCSTTYRCTKSDTFNIRLDYYYTLYAFLYTKN